MDQELNNLRVIERKIADAIEKHDEDTADAWMEAADRTLERLRAHFKRMREPRSAMAKLVHDHLNLPG